MISKQQMIYIRKLWKLINAISKIYDNITQNGQQSTTETNITNLIKVLLSYITQLSLNLNEQQCESKL